jgi:hypothetical protein
MLALSKKAMKAAVYLGVVVFALSVQAQDPAQFNEKVHDFGEIEESTQPSTYTFSFVNQSTDSLRINSVKASCGCTTPSWTRAYVAPGDTGYLTAAYRTYNRPGSFNKSLRISWSTGQQQVLYIKGSVNPREKTPKETYPVAVGNLRTKFQAFNIGKFTTEKEITKAFVLYNDSKDTITLQPELHQLPEFLTLSSRFNAIPPQTRLRMSFSIDPSKMDRFGFLQSGIQLATTDAEVPMKSYLLFTTVEEYFPPMTDEELANAPKLTFDVNAIDFGTVSGTTEIEKIITLTNSGKSKLNIRQIDTNCDCVVTGLKKENIAPGKSTNLKIKFVAEERKGRQYKTITVFSNDPSNPTQTLSVKALVK